MSTGNACSPESWKVWTLASLETCLLRGIRDLHDPAWAKEYELEVVLPGTLGHLPGEAGTDFGEDAIRELLAEHAWVVDPKAANFNRKTGGWYSSILHPGKCFRVGVTMIRAVPGTMVHPKESSWETKHYYGYYLPTFNAWKGHGQTILTFEEGMRVFDTYSTLYADGLNIFDALKAAVKLA